MKKITLLLLVLTCQFTISQEILTNQSIVDLIEMGFGSEVIKSKINSEEANFDTTLKELKRLKNLNVPSDVLALMIDKSKVVVDAGIFYSIGDTVEKIEPNTFSGTKSSALASAVSYGIAKAKLKSYISGESSKNKVQQSNQTLVFRFETDKSNLVASNWWFTQASSPSDFVLTKLKQKKGDRELVTGSVRGISASTQFGIDTKDTIPFKIEEVAKGIFKVTADKPLGIGEYCMVYQGSLPAGGYVNQSIFDFSIVN